jgi:hypothetical protein
MKMARNLIILVVILCVLVGAFYYVQTMEPKDEDEEDSDPISEVVSTLDKEKIIELTVEREGETLTLYKEKDEWKVKGHEDVELDQTRAGDSAHFISEVRAKDIIEGESQNLADFGLEKPRMVITVKLENGESKSFRIGDETPDKSGSYMMMNDDEKIYVVFSSLVNSMKVDLDALRDFAVVKYKADDLRYIKMKQKDQPAIELVYGDTSVFSVSDWVMKEPYQWGVDGKTLGEILGKITSLELNEYVADGEENLKEYGLDEPSASLEVKGKDEKTVELILGKKKDDDLVYCMLGGNDAIYTIEQSQVDFLKTEPFKMISRYALVVKEDTVDKLSLESPDQSGTVEIVREGEKVSYKLDGSQVDEEAFKEFYKELVGLELDGTVKEEADGNPEITVTFHRNESPEAISAAYIPYDENNYAVSIDGGKPQFYIRKSKLEDLLEEFKEMKE